MIALTDKQLDEATKTAKIMHDYEKRYIEFCKEWGVKPSSRGIRNALDFYLEYKDKLHFDKKAAKRLKKALKIERRFWKKLAKKRW